MSLFTKVFPFDKNIFFIVKKIIKIFIELESVQSVIENWLSEFE